MGLCGGRLYWAFQTGTENIFSPQNLKRFKAVGYFWRSWSGDETTFLPAILQVLRDEHRFWLISRGVWKILAFNHSKRVKNHTFLFMDGFGWLFNSIFLSGCRCEIWGQRTPARPAVKFWTSKHLVWLWVERGSGRAGRVTLDDASRSQYQPRRGRTTERMDSPGKADRRDAVEQNSTTEWMTDTTMRTRTRDRAQPWLRMQPC